MPFRSSIVAVVIVFVALTATAQETRSAVEQTTALASPPAMTGAGNTASNRDYLSLIIAALESYSESGGEAITFDYNFPLFGQKCENEGGGAVVGAGRFECVAAKAQVLLKQPLLNTNFVKHLTDNGLADSIPAFEDELSYTDDVTFTLAISPQARKAADDVKEMLRRAPVQREMQTMRLQRVNRAREAAGQSRIERTTFDAELTDPLRRAEIDRQVAEDAAQLAVHQSKWNFDASYRRRRATVGPNEWIVKVSYEHGFGTNISRRLAEKRATGCISAFRQADSLSSECMNPVAAAIAEAANAPTVQQGRRLTASLEFHDLSAIEIGGGMPEPYGADGSRSLIWSLNGGWDVFSEKPNESTGRMELTVSYDDVSGDPNRKDRLIGRLTYSQRVSDKLYIPISLVYANHADYLTNVDRKLNAHFGLAYKIPNSQ